MDFKKIEDKFLNFWLINIIRKTSKKLIIPGFDGLSLNDVSIFFFKGLWQGSITTRAAALSFTFFLALFPAIIFFFTLIPYIPIHNFQNTLLAMLQNILPKAAYDNALNTLIDIIKRQHGSLLSIGFIMSLYFSTSSTSGIMRAFNDSVHVKETRPFIKQKLISILLVLIFSVLIIIAISFIIAGSSFFHFLLKAGIVHKNFTYYALHICKWIIIIALSFFSISFLYYLAPARHERFRFISAGSTLATFLFIITSIGFNYYISHFSHYNKLYGSIGALIIILTWIYFNAIVLLIGYELNAGIMNAKGNKK
jgi:membrane protein